MRARSVLGTLIVASLVASVVPSYSAPAPKAGAVCRKAGVTQSYNGKKFKCVKSGKKLVWSKGKIVKVATPAATPTTQPTPIPTTQPTPSPSPSVSATPSTMPSVAPSPVTPTISASEALQQYRDAFMRGNRCDVKKESGRNVLGIDLYRKPTYLRCNNNGFWVEVQNPKAPDSYQPKVNISDFNSLTYPWKSPCDADPWVPDQWREYEQFALKYFGCSRPLRFVDVALPNTKPSTALTPTSQLQPISMCKLPHKNVKNVRGNYHNIGHDGRWKFTGDFAIQVVPVQFTDFKAAKSPKEEYGKYLDYMKEMFFKISDGNSRIEMRVPDSYIQVNAALDSFDTGQTFAKNDKFSWKKLDTPRYQNAIFTAADQSINFTGIDLTIILVPLSVPDNYIGHGGGFRMDNVRTNEGIVKSNYIMPPANTNSDNDWYGVEPFLHLHEMFHATGLLSDHLGDWEIGGDFYGTGFWGHMSGMLTDFIAWDKWLAGMMVDSQIICGSSTATGTYWIKPATYFGKHEKLLVIPLSDTKAIAIESQRAGGMNFKLTKESEGALLYTVDVMDTRYDGGFEVIKPKNRTSSTIEGPFIFWDAPMKLNESIEVWGYRVTVVEAGAFGDVVKVEKI